MGEGIEQIGNDRYALAMRSQMKAEERLRELEEPDFSQERAVEDGKGEYIDIYV